MRKSIFFLAAAILLLCTNVYAEDILIDINGSLSTGTSNNYGNLKVSGASGEHAVAGETSGTGAAGVFGTNFDNGNYGALGSDSYGVYGNSSTGNAGYFEGNARVTGDLTVDGTITGEADPTVAASVKDGVDWTELSGIPAGFADGIDDTGGSDIWTRVNADIYFSGGNVGIGTSNPRGNLDVNGSLCLGSTCRTSWPLSGSGAFTDTGTEAYYNGGNVGVGTATPVPLNRTDTKVLHLAQPVQTLDYTASGIRLEVENQVTGGLSSAYSQLTGEAGVFVGALSNHRLGFITNSMEKMTLASNGYLGIDTTSPQQPLHVQGNAYISGALGIGTASPTNDLQVSGSSALFSSDTGDFRLSVSKNLESGISSILFADNYSARAEIGLTYDDNFHIKVSPDGTTLTDALIIDRTTGNIGVNTSDLSYRLHVIGESNNAIWAESTSALPTLNVIQYGTGFGMRLINNSTTTKAGFLLVNNSAGAALQISSLGTGPVLTASTSSGEVVRVDSAGNVGIGTATPQSSLQVNGYAQLDLTSGAPPAADCDAASERGRMKVDNAAGLLYICVDSGWIAK